jgi:hypothetical protein
MAEEILQEKEHKYNCERCNYRCNENSKWEKHINTEKHKTGKNKKRSDYEGPYNCEICNYETENKSTFLQHRLNYHSTKEERAKEFKYYCKVCDYGTISKDILDKHNLTEKHKRKVLINI